MTAINHPAKFSAPIIEAIQDEIDHAGPDRLVLDPFAGIGLIHQIVGHRTIGVEIEPEWAGAHPRTICGDATRMPFAAGSFDVVATSPTYGNRMADRYDGRDGSKRYTYRIALGHDLHPRNTGGMRWGRAYWHMHWSAWCEARRVLRPEGVLILNISDHIRVHETAPVVEWHKARLTELGFRLWSDLEVKTRRNGNGANRDARAEAEHVLTFVAPPPKETPA